MTFIDIIPVLIVSFSSLTNPRSLPYSGTSITLYKHSLMQKLQFYEVTMVMSFQNHTLNEFMFSSTRVSVRTPPAKWGCRAKNRHFMVVVSSLMLFAFLPFYLGVDIVLTAAHLINRMLSRVLHL